MAIFGKKSQRKSGADFDSADTNLAHQIQDWVSFPRPRIGDVLVEMGLVEPEAVENALLMQAAEAQAERAALEAGEDGSGFEGNAPVRPRVGEVLMRDGFLDEMGLAAALGRQLGVPVADLHAESPDAEAIGLVPEELAREHAVLPLRVDDGRLDVVTADPFDTVAIRAITDHVGKVALRIGAPSEIAQQLDRAYNVLNEADQHIRAFELSYDEPDTTEEVDDTFKVDDNAPVVQVVTRIITQAVRQRASDVHIEPSEAQVRVRYRIDGAMTEAIDLPGRMGPAVTSRIKVMSELNIVERRRAQDGQFSMMVDDRPIDFRVSVVPTVHGEKTVLRLLDKTKALISLSDLGMSDDVADQFRDIVSAPLGMLLCTGPTGSGKTTTLYATLNELRDPSKNIVTIEDPVEYQFDGITQMQVSGTTMNFADGLRGILRQDPDTILVGEIRDEDTSRIAMQAALTGHFVLSSLHAVDASAAVHRFMDMGIEPFLVSSALSAVVGQRLLRRICSACAEPYQPLASEVRMLERYSTLTPEWLRGRGCELCAGTGYLGRVGVYELLVLTDSIRDLIVARATHHAIKAQAVKDGMRTMQQEAFDLVARGQTTVEDVVRSVYAAGMDSEEAAPMGELMPANLALADRSDPDTGDAADAESETEDGPTESEEAHPESPRFASGESEVIDLVPPTMPASMGSSSGEER